jgi:oligosaccharide repeat unit polymerase
MIFLYFVVFISFAVLLTYLDKKLWGTMLTPVVVLVWPFITLLVIDFFYLKSSYGYFDLNPKVILIWFFGMLFFWVGGVLIKLSFINVKVNKLDLDIFNKEVNISKSKLRLLFLIAYPLIFLVVFKGYFLLSSYGFNLADDDFQQNLGSGLIAHSILLLTIISIFLIVFFNKKYSKTAQIFIIVATLIFSVFYGVKSWIIIPLVSSFLGRLLLQKTRINIRHLFVFIAPFFVFWLIYKISLGFESSNDEFIIEHMADYLLAGPIGFSEHLNQNLPIGSNPGYVFTPLINICHFLIGMNPLGVISSYFVNIPTGFETNVKSFFGTLYVYGGYSYVLTSFLFGAIFYAYLLLFCFSLKSRIAPFVTVLYVFMLGLLFMGWFETYVMHLTFYEVPFWAFVLYLLYKIKFI